MGETLRFHRTYERETLSQRIATAVVHQLECLRPHIVKRNVGNYWLEAENKCAFKEA